MTETESTVPEVPAKSPEQQQIEQLEKRINELAAGNVVTRRELLAAHQELENFKTTVRDVAVKYAERHDWCDTVWQALDEMGLQPPRKKVTATFTVEYTVEGYVDWDKDVTESWVRDSINVYDYPELDSDWDDVAIDHHDISVSDYDTSSSS